eukprot:GEZU01001232.1.p1 GENE.GEZU01001232.1~~GEZU01001232.1.p1  ORF type:complete len:127 (-),score=15.88 GEZU01001232.1:277-657(-)
MRRSQLCAAILALLLVIGVAVDLVFADHAYRRHKLRGSIHDRFNEESQNNAKSTVGADPNLSNASPHNKTLSFKPSGFDSRKIVTPVAVPGGKRSLKAAAYPLEEDEVKENKENKPVLMGMSPCCY